jgi:hypothetical protein
MTWIADQEVAWIFPGGERRPGRIAIGSPWLVPDGNGEAKCAVSLDGLEDSCDPLSGDGTLEALIIAVRFVGWRMHVFMSQGGHVTRQIHGASESYPERFKDLFGSLLADPPRSPTLGDP